MILAEVRYIFFYVCIRIGWRVIVVEFPHDNLRLRETVVYISHFLCTYETRSRSRWIVIQKLAKKWSRHPSPHMETSGRSIKSEILLEFTMNLQ